MQCNRSEPTYTQSARTCWQPLLHLKSAPWAGLYEQGRGTKGWGAGGIGGCGLLRTCMMWSEVANQVCGSQAQASLLQRTKPTAAARPHPCPYNGLGQVERGCGRGSGQHRSMGYRLRSCPVTGPHTGQTTQWTEEKAPSSRPPRHTHRRFFGPQTQLRCAQGSSSAASPASWP